MPQAPGIQDPKILEKTRVDTAQLPKDDISLSVKKVKDLPFGEIMELINAKHGFFYNKDSKKKLDRYARKVSRRIVRRSERKPREAAKLAGYSSHSYPKVIRNLKKEITELAETHLSTHSAQAANRLIALLDEDGTTPQAGIRLAAANSILDRVGINMKVKKDNPKKIVKQDCKYESSARYIYITSKRCLRNR